MFVVKDPQFLTNVFDEDNPTQSPTFLFFDSFCDGNLHSFEMVGRNVITYLSSKMNYTIQTGKVTSVLCKYGYTPEGMYKYVLYYITQYYFL